MATVVVCVYMCVCVLCMVAPSKVSFQIMQPVVKTLPQYMLSVKLDVIISLSTVPLCM